MSAGSLFDQGGPEDPSYEDKERNRRQKTVEALEQKVGQRRGAHVAIESEQDGEETQRHAGRERRLCRIVAGAHDRAAPANG